MGTNLLAPSEARKFRFGSFEVDLEEHELYNRGIRVGLQHKPFRILELLLRKRGALVTRQELAEHLWPNLHVSFDRGLNTAINVLRRALGDSPTNCRYIETRSGLGYRFIAQVEEIHAPAPAEIFQTASLNGTPSPDSATRHSARHNSIHASEAGQDYLKGRYFYGKLREEDLRRSIAHFESALRLDPGYALAYTGLADAYTLVALFGALPAAALRPRVSQYANAALEIDPQLAEAHVSLATLKKFFDWDWNAAEREYRAALARDPNCAAACQSYAALLCACGQTNQARHQIHRAQQLDPLSLSVSAQAAWIFYMCRDFQAALEQSWKTLALEPRFAPAQHTLGLACLQLAMHEEALTELENARACSDNHPAAIAAIAHAHAAHGDRAEALRALRELEQISHHRRVSPYWMGIVHTGLDAQDHALEWIEKAVEERDPWLLWLNVEPRFHPLRRDPRFDRLLRRLGMPPDNRKGESGVSGGS